jgi:hypothetical protein
LIPGLDIEVAETLRALKVAANKKAKAAALTAKDDAAAKARMEAEGGAMKPVTPARRAKRTPARRK